MPIEPQDAYIGDVSGAMIVTLNSNVTVHSIATSADAEFGIGNGTASTLIAYDGTVLNSEDASSVASGNLGSIGVEPGSALQIGNTFDNAGTLAIGKGAGVSGDDSASLYLNDTLVAVTLDGGGTVDLGQLANASQSEIQTYGDILNAPGTSGNGLVNVDNTITGGGVISLGSFDNQASGVVEASQSGGYWLQISASTFSNEGVMTAESGATLNLGADGATETLTNDGSAPISGAINVDSGASLAISGNFTVTGSGAIAFKGAGADITSDGKPATFTNGSTIALEASLSSSGPFSGQIGDQGVLGVNDLTFVNDGTTFVDGSGYTLTINTGGKTVTNGSSGTLDAESGATLAIVSSLTNSGTIEAGTSTPTTGTVDLGEDGATRSMTNTGAVDIYGGSDLAISGNYTITTPSSSTSGAIVFKGAGADITSDGNAVGDVHQCEHHRLRFASGQIGDEGILAVNDLTFHNSGTVAASGSGVTLTINTGGNTVLNAASDTIVAENDATLAILSNLNNQGAMEAGTSASSANGASTGTLDLGKDGGNGIDDRYRGESISGATAIWRSAASTPSPAAARCTSKGAGAEITSAGPRAGVHQCKHHRGARLRPDRRQRPDVR